MPQSKRNLIKATIAAGLASANRGSIFWTKSDAMASFSVFHRNQHKIKEVK